jgi:LPS-assembly protein
MKTGTACAAALLVLLLLARAAPAPAAISVPGDMLSMPRTGPDVMLGAPVTLNADSLAYDDDTGVALAEGNVELGFGNRTMRADRIRYDSRSGEAELTGHVHYKDAGDEFSFDRIVLNLNTELGVLYNGTIRLAANNYQISSERFEKTGKKTFQIRKGILTTCPCDPEPDWKFEVRRTQVTLDGYAVGKDVMFKIRGVPVLWFPWAAFPVKLTRQSGFLTPSFSHGGSKGYAFQLPYYWAISRWSDATLTIEEMSRRGLRPEVEYRYVLSSTSGGEAHVSIHHDKQTKHDRYRILGNNSYREGAVTSGVKLDLASDDRYYLDLVDDDILRTGRHIPSRGFLAYGTEQGMGAMSAVYVNDVQGTPDDNTVQRLPEASFTFLPRTLGRSGIDVAGEARASYFYRRVGDRELQGRGYGEISRTFTLYPSITVTPYLSVDLLGSYPASNETGIGSGGRVLPGGGGKLEVDFRRSFERGPGTRLIHAVQTNTSFRWIPAADQNDIPIVDGGSRVGEQQQFTFSVTQRLLRVDNVTGPYELAFLAVEWALDVGRRKPTGSPYIDPLSPFVRSLREQIDLAAGRSAVRREAASDIYARFRVRPALKWAVSGESLFDAGEGRFTTASLGGEWKQSEESRALVEYRRSRDLAEDVHGLIAVRLHRVVGVKTDVNYSMKNKQLTEGTATLTLYPRSDCWSVGLVTSRKTKPEETSYKLLFSLKGIGGIGN